MDIGFTTFGEVEATPKPTAQEMFALLGAGDAVKILNGFAEEIKPKRLCHLENIHREPVLFFYGKLKQVRDKAAQLMRQEILVTPAEYDEEGNETSPAVYNDKPGTTTALKAELAVYFPEFNATQLTAIVNKMYQYSNPTNTGDFNFYASEIVK